jgi:chemosensory pili system protein ChpB (putative protein-glutamate methylesterase)
MTENNVARIAVIADTSLQRHVLQQALTGSGYQVVLNSDPARLDEATLAACETDLWLIDLAQSEDLPLVDELMEKASAPILFGEGHAPERHSENYPRWERRLFGKLKKLIGDPSQAVGPSLQALLAEAQRPIRLDLPQVLADTPLVVGEPARQVWLLAASLGGPAAVCRWASSMPSISTPISSRRCRRRSVGIASGASIRRVTAIRCAAARWWWCRSVVSWASATKAPCRSAKVPGRNPTARRSIR